MKLQARGSVSGFETSEILRLRVSPDSLTDHDALLCTADSIHPEPVVTRTIVAPRITEIMTTETRLVCALPDLDYLSDGDVIAVRPDGFVRVLYRRASNHNSIFVTDQCNSYCVMCSQPPKVVDDRGRITEILKLIDLIDIDTRELGVTGGEPTLFGADFIEIIDRAKTRLPRTALHVLTNGRLFASRDFARELSASRHPDLMLGIPLYSSLDWQHDHVVQARGAFAETIAGLLNLDREGVRIELRFVLHGLTAGYLPRLAAFITRNLPFVAQVAIMGLEPIGFARANAHLLAVDDGTANRAMASAVETLALAEIPVALYNQQLCHLERALWPFAVKSISDWKNDYAAECSGCAERHRCAGFFTWDSARLPHPFTIESEAFSKT